MFLRNKHAGEFIVARKPADQAVHRDDIIAAAADVLRENGYELLGVSPDNLKKHDKFKNKYDLPFPLIADEDHSVMDAFGV
ncbi:MAG: redoxin domain-containing protein, partial [Chloroflexota bacterium]